MCFYFVFATCSHADSRGRTSALGRFRSSAFFGYFRLVTVGEFVSNLRPKLLLETEVEKEPTEGGKLKSGADTRSVDAE